MLASDGSRLPHLTVQPDSPPFNLPAVKQVEALQEVQVTSLVVKYVPMSQCAALLFSKKKASVKKYVCGGWGIH